MYEQFVQKMPIQLIAPWRNPTPSPNNDLDLMMDIDQNGTQEPSLLGLVYSAEKLD